MKDGSMPRHEVTKWKIKDFSRLYVVPPLKNGVHYKRGRELARQLAQKEDSDCECPDGIAFKIKLVEGWNLMEIPSNYPSMEIIKKNAEKVFPTQNN
jgi:hypothetical protein